MGIVKKVLFWVLVASVAVIIEKKTGVFSYILTLGHKFNNPLVS